MASGKREARRVHSAQLKATVIDRCAEPGASVAAIAMEHGVNANLVHRWRRIAEGRAPSRDASGVSKQFVPVTIDALTQASTLEASIRIEVRRAGVVAQVQWPLSHAAQCAAWLRELMR